MADQGNSTLLTAARARRLAGEIKENRATVAVAHAIACIKEAAKNGRYAVAVTDPVFADRNTSDYSGAILMLRALGYRVEVGAKGYVYISW